MVQKAPESSRGGSRSSSSSSRAGSRPQSLPRAPLAGSRARNRVPDTEIAKEREGHTSTVAEKELLALLDPLTTEHFYSKQALLDTILSGAIAPMRGSYLMELQRTNDQLPRRQALPPEALWPLAELRHTLDELGDDFGLLYVAVSYRWLDHEHPDPDRFHLAILSQVLEKYLRPKDSSMSPLASVFPKAWAVGYHDHLPGHDRDVDCVVFWDFASLYQSPWLADEEVLYRAG